MDENFSTWQLQNVSGFPGGFEARYTIIVVEGVIEVCGAIAYTNAQLRRIFRQGMRRATVKMNDQDILRDLTFFHAAKRPGDLDTGPANCRSTGVKRPAGDPEFLISTRFKGSV